MSNIYRIRINENNIIEEDKVDSSSFFKPLWKRMNQEGQTLPPQFSLLDVCIQNILYFFF